MHTTLETKANFREDLFGGVNSASFFYPLAQWNLVLIEQTKIISLAQGDFLLN